MIERRNKRRLPLPLAVMLLSLLVLGMAGLGGIAYLIARLLGAV
jgi:hypothetical protein